MNELLADALANQLLPLQQQGIITTLSGLVTLEETDAFSGEKNKALAYPVPVPKDGFQQKAIDWKLLLPDPKKKLIVFFEGHEYQQKMLAGIWQTKARLTMIAWYNGLLLKVNSRDEVAQNLVATIGANGRAMPPYNSGLNRIQLTGYGRVLSDPFTKYTAYNNLFNFRDRPYGWCAIDISLTAYGTPVCAPELTDVI
jgi:hypothetical protein